MGMVRVVKNIRETVIVPDGSVERIVPGLLPEFQRLQAGNIYLAGLSEAAEGHLIERKAPGIHEALFSLAGGGRISSEGCSSDVLAGDLVIAPGHCHYRYECVQAPWRFAWFEMKDAGPWRVFRTMPVQVRKSRVAAPIEGVVMHLLAESMGREAHWERMTALLCEQVMLYLEREFSVDELPHERPICREFEELWEFVSGRLDRAWTVRELAARLNTSPSSFYRMCLRNTGLNPHHMLLRLRMQRAEDLLMNYEYPLKSIGKMLGYGTPFAFSNAFKRYRGMSPRAFRAGFRGHHT